MSKAGEEATSFLQIALLGHSLCCRTQSSESRTVNPHLRQREDPLFLIYALTGVIKIALNDVGAAIFRLQH